MSKVPGSGDLGLESRIADSTSEIQIRDPKSTSRLRGQRRLFTGFLCIDLSTCFEFKLQLALRQWPTHSWNSKRLVQSRNSYLTAYRIFIQQYIDTENELYIFGVQNFGRPAFCSDPPVFQHHDLIGKFGRQIKVVRYHYRRCTGRAGIARARAGTSSPDERGRDSRSARPATGSLHRSLTPGRAPPAAVRRPTDDSSTAFQNRPGRTLPKRFRADRISSSVSQPNEPP